MSIVFKGTHQAARRQYICEWCAGRIKKGETYFRYAYYEDRMYTTKMHEECREAMERWEKDPYNLDPDEFSNDCVRGKTPME